LKKYKENMMKSNYKFTLIIIFLFTAYASYLSAQNESHGVVFWSQERDLEWDDFKGRTFEDSLDNFYLDLYITSANASEANSFFLFGQKPSAYLFSNTSYVDNDIRNDDLLRLLNVYWDLSGYYAYKMTSMANSANDNDEEMIRKNPSILQNAIIEEWRSESKRLFYDTKYGLEIEKLLIWEQKVDDLVAFIQEPKVLVSDYALGFDFSGGYLFKSKKFSELQDGKGAFHIAMEITRKSLVFALGITAHHHTVRETFMDGDNIFLKGSEPFTNHVFLHTGYKILNNENFRLIPRFGLQFSNLGYSKEKNDEDRSTSISYTGGITADIKLWKWRYHSVMSPVLSDLSLRFGAYYYPMSVGPNNFSTAVITAGISWTIGGAILKYNH
jgi:hypothetical protein